MILHAMSLLAVSAMEQYLIRTKKRTAVSIILESAEPRDVHHFATLLGYGARAINPYLAQECITELVAKNRLDKDTHQAIADYNNAVLHGIVKIASKMGISTLQSYQSAQIFEAVGICKEVIDEYFTNTVSPVEGIGLQEIGEGVQWRHNHAFDLLELGVDTTLDSVGSHKLRSGDGAEDHMYNPQTIVALRDAVRSGSYEKVLIEAKDTSMNEMMNRAAQMGANAVVGIDLDYETVGQQNAMMMVSASGTAVVID